MIALTHLPSPNLHAGERNYISRQPIDFAVALRQHAAYCQMLCECGWDVRTLSHYGEMADSTFIEDTAVVLEKVAIMASMGAPSRQNEPTAIAPILQHWREVRRIEPPALLEGGDVLQVGRLLLVGRSRRSNAAGIESLANIVRPYGYEVVTVEVTGCLHLKTAVCALPDGRLLINPEWLPRRDLRAFTYIPIPKHEPFAANILLSGECIVLPNEHVATAELLCREFDVKPVAMSEFAKAEGGVTCLSLLVQ